MAYIPPHRRPGPGVTPKRQEEDSDVEALVHKTFSRVFCINRASRGDKWKTIQQEALLVGESFARKMERFDAIEGTSPQVDLLLDDVVLEWDCSQNAKYSRRIQWNTQTPCMRVMTSGEVGCALSHIAIWRQLAGDSTSDEKSSVLILEDDATFTMFQGKSRFAKAVANAMKNIPDGWDILYLGFSSRGERHYVDARVATSNNSQHDTQFRPRVVRWQNPLDPDIQLYQPTYGYHTHAYAITKKAASALVHHHIPIQGPIGVWLANNHWFGLAVYCAVIANEGWKLDDGTFEGTDLVRQGRESHCVTGIIPSTETVDNFSHDR